MGSGFCQLIMSDSANDVASELVFLSLTAENNQMQTQEGNKQLTVRFRSKQSTFVQSPES